MDIDVKKFSRVIDHTYLKTEKEGVSIEEQKVALKKLIDEAFKFQSFSVCVRPDRVPFVHDLIEKTKYFHPDVHVPLICSVIGFPDGELYSTDEKIRELVVAKEYGAVEFDMVLRVNDLKNGNYDAVYQDIYAMSHAAKDDCLKVIYEVAYLTDEEIIKASEICIRAFRDSGHTFKRFLKTSTGFAKRSDNGPIGATLHTVELIHQVSQGKFGIKPAGGVQNGEDTIAFFKAAGAPMRDGAPDPYLFRIGASNLLTKLFGESVQDIKNLDPNYG